MSRLSEIGSCKLAALVVLTLSATVMTAVAQNMGLVSCEGSIRKNARRCRHVDAQAVSMKGFSPRAPGNLPSTK
jgi:hypothetical protein